MYSFLLVCLSVIIVRFTERHRIGPLGFWFGLSITALVYFLLAVVLFFPHREELIKAFVASFSLVDVVWLVDWVGWFVNGCCCYVSETRTLVVYQDERDTIRSKHLS